MKTIAKLLISMLIVIGFSMVGYTNTFTDNDPPPVPQIEIPIECGAYENNTDEEIDCCMCHPNQCHNGYPLPWAFGGGTSGR